MSSSEQYCEISAIVSAGQCEIHMLETRIGRTSSDMCIGQSLPAVHRNDPALFSLSTAQIYDQLFSSDEGAEIL
jgi:hypothetical protein